MRLRPDGAVADDMLMRGFVPWRLRRELFVASGLKIVLTDRQLVRSLTAGGSLAGLSLAGQLPATVGRRGRAVYGPNLGPVATAGLRAGRILRRRRLTWATVGSVAALSVAVIVAPA